MPAKRKNEKVVGKYFTWLLGQRNGVWFADARSNIPNPGRHSLGTRDQAEALRLVHQLDVKKAVEFGMASEAELYNDTAALLHFDQGVALYLNHVRRPRVVGGAGPKTPRRYKAVFDKAVPYFKELGLVAWNQVKKCHLESYGAWLDSEHYAYRTEFLELTTIKQAFKYWSDPEVGLLPPEARIKLHMLKPTDTDTYCWRPVEVQAIVGRCREESGLGWLGDVLAGLATTGMRISELSSLTWGDVQGDMILLKDETRSKLAQHRSARTTKSRRSRAFPINSEFAEVLNERRKYSETGTIFVGPLGGAIRPDSIRIALIEKILRPLAAKFPSEGEVGFVDGRLHSFRHYFCSECAHRRVPEQTVMHWLGHRSSLMVRHYYHLHDDEAQRQMANLKFLGGPDAT